MILPRFTFVLLLCVSLVLLGCQVDTSSRTVSQMSSRDGPAMHHAPWRGQYRLYSVPPNARNALEQVGTPVATVHLKKGEAVGFRKNAEGAVVAVAGQQEIPIPDGRYEWVMQADGGQTDPVKTVLLVVAIVVVVLGVIVIIAAIQINHDLNNFGK